MTPRKHKPPRKPAGNPLPDAEVKSVGLRIIGGRFRGRKLVYSGDLRVRPMKDRVREAVFNLVGPAVQGKYAVDLFAGTGALGLEALSRGAAGATFIERHYPTAAVIRENIAILGVAPLCEVVTANVFLWGDRRFRNSALPLAGESPLANSPLPPAGEGQGMRAASIPEDAEPRHPPAQTPPWLVFCSPPYDFYVERLDEMLRLLGTLIAAAPSRSVFVVESDERFDFGVLPEPQAWDVRTYAPAVIGIYDKAESGSDGLA